MISSCLNTFKYIAEGATSLATTAFSATATVASTVANAALFATTNVVTTIYREGFHNGVVNLASESLSSTTNAINELAIVKKIKDSPVRVSIPIKHPEGININYFSPPIEKVSAYLNPIEKKLTEIISTQPFDYTKTAKQEQIKVSEEAKKKTDEQCRAFIEDFSAFTLLDTMLNWSGWNPTEDHFPKILEMIQLKRSDQSGTTWEIFNRQMDQELTFFQMAKAGIIYFCLEYCTGMISESLKSCIESFKEQTRRARAGTTLPLDTLLEEFIKEFDPFLENHQKSYTGYATSTDDGETLNPFMQKHAVEKTFPDELKIYQEWSETFIRIYLPKIPLFHKWFNLPFPMNHLMKLCAAILEPIVTWFAKPLLSRFILPSALKTIAHSTIEEQPLGFVASMVRTCLTQVSDLLKIMKKESVSRDSLPKPCNIVEKQENLKGMLQKLFTSIKYQTSLRALNGKVINRTKITDDPLPEQKEYIQGQLAGVFSNGIFNAVQYLNDPAKTEDILHAIFTNARSIYTLQDPTIPLLSKESHAQTKDYLVEHVETLIDLATNDKIGQLFHGIPLVRKKATLNKHLDEIKQASTALSDGVTKILQERIPIADDQPIAILQEIIAIRNQFLHVWSAIKNASSLKEANLGEEDQKQFIRTIKPLYDLYNSCADALTQLCKLQEASIKPVAQYEAPLKLARKEVEKVEKTIKTLEELKELLPRWKELTKSQKKFLGRISLPRIDRKLFLRNKISPLCKNISSSEDIYQIFRDFIKKKSPANAIKERLQKENSALNKAKDNLQKLENERVEKIKEYKNQIEENFKILENNINNLKLWNDAVQLKEEPCLRATTLLSITMATGTALFTSSSAWVGWAAGGAAAVAVTIFADKIIPKIIPKKWLEHEWVLKVTLETALETITALFTAIATGSAIFNSSLGWSGWTATAIATAIVAKKIIPKGARETGVQAALVSVGAFTSPFATPVLIAAVIPHLVERVAKTKFSSILKTELQAIEEGVSELWSLPYFSFSCFLGLLKATKTTIEKRNAPV